MKKGDTKTRINSNITAKEVKVVDVNGEMLGVLDINKALERADMAGLDLVEIAPNSVPPVCKILNYGKYKYELQKKLNDAKKHHKVVEIKEVKFRVNIERNDYEVKVRNILRFLNDNNKVKVTLRFRGREIAYNKNAMELFDSIITDLGECVKVDVHPKIEGRQLIMVLSSNNKKIKPEPKNE